MPSFPPADLKPITWSSQFLAANKARKHPLNIQNCSPDFRLTYHYVPKPVLQMLQRQNSQEIHSPPHSSPNDTQYLSFNQTPSALPSPEQFHTPLEQPSHPQQSINEDNPCFTNPSFTSFKTPQSYPPLPQVQTNNTQKPTTPYVTLEALHPPITQLPITYAILPTTTLMIPMTSTQPASDMFPLPPSYSHVQRNKQQYEPSLPPPLPPPSPPRHSPSPPRHSLSPPKLLPSPPQPQPPPPQPLPLQPLPNDTLNG